jgi:Na+-driven multidrug efflux pump
VIPSDPSGAIETVTQRSPVEPVLDMPAVPAHDLRGRVLGLAAPVIGENLLQTLLGVIFLLFADLLMRLFTSDPQMMASGAPAVRVTALAQPLWAASFVLAGALRGTGNTRTPMLITGAAMWALVGLAYLTTHFVYQSLSAIWAAFLVTGPLEVLCFWLAWRAWLRRNL